uniref:Uncharacterized protein n=1 Tax=Peromyscus maniculatus bairdii TaxID=230844 RepID=A0A8C8UFS9_PERMB
TFPLRENVKKSEMGMPKAQHQLDVVLHCLLEKSHIDREHLDKEAVKTPPNAYKRDCPIASTDKMPSAYFPHQKEVEEGDE